MTPRLATIVPVALATTVILLILTATSAQLEGLFISTEALPWEESRATCLAMDKVLLSIHTEAYDKDLVHTLNGIELPGNIWTSGVEVREGAWIWNSTGEPFYHTRWFVGQPDDTDKLNCFYLATTAHFYWRDANCTAPMYFICEDPIQSWL